MKYTIIGAFAVPQEGCGCDPCSTHCTLADNVLYTGPNLQCTDIRTNNNLTLSLQKIDEKICELFDLYYSLTTTSSTSTTTSTSTSTTTYIPLCIFDGNAIQL